MREYLTVFLSGLRTTQRDLFALRVKEDYLILRTYYLTGTILKCNQDQ
jgi:hypothetical protein